MGHPSGIQEDARWFDIYVIDSRFSDTIEYCLRNYRRAITRMVADAGIAKAIEDEILQLPPRLEGF